MDLQAMSQRESSLRNVRYTGESSVPGIWLGEKNATAKAYRYATACAPTSSPGIALGFTDSEGGNLKQRVREEPILSNKESLSSGC